MLKNWNDRPEVTANLVNPAFCCEVIKECIKGYKSEISENLPYPYAILVLPFILPGRIRNILPKSKATSLHTWLNENGNLKINIADHIKGFMPFSKEAVMF